MITLKETVKSNIEKGLHFDFHIHSRFSFDSLLQPKQIIRVAEKRGLYGIAITDHETIKGGLEAFNLRKSKLRIIIGSEIKTEEGDVISLFLNEEINSRLFSEVVDEIKDQDGIVVLPHPYKGKKIIPHRLLRKIDVIEVLNGRMSKELNHKAQILAKKNQIPIIGGSDAHLAREIGRIRTIFDCGKDEINDLDDIKKLIMHGECKIIGKESPRHVHYFSVVVGNIRKREVDKLGKLVHNKLKS